MLPFREGSWAFWESKPVPLETTEQVACGALLPSGCVKMGLAEAAFLMVGYKWPIFTFAYIIYMIPSLPSSLSAVLCIDLSFTLQPHFALLHFNDI